MKQNNMTTIMVHSMLSSQRPHKPSLNESPILTMTVQYELDKPIGNTQEMRQRIRSRSYYAEKSKIFQNKKKLSNKKIYGKIYEKEEHALSQPKIIDLQFQTFSRAKRKKQLQKSLISTQQYRELMVDSMQQYIRKVQKGKKRKIEKCDRIRHFGVNIQSINPQPEENKVVAITQKYKKQKAKIRQQIKVNQISLNELTYKANKSFLSELTQKNLSKTISTSVNTTKSKFISKKINLKPEKKDDDRKITSKYSRMFNHFYIILSSFGVFLDKTETKDKQDIDLQVKTKKNDRKYTYFVGRGNNKNLIVSILKKRWWWTEAEDMSSANFVWTQLKNSLILQKQSSMMFSDLQQAQPSLYICHQKNQQNETIQQDQIYNIFHKNHNPKFHEKLPYKQQKKYLRKMKVPQVIHNHYEANYMLGNKKALFYNMTQYKRFRNQNAFQYIPLTFHIENVKSKAFKIFEKKAKEQKKSLWIVKPGQNSNRGQGIFVSDSIESIKNKIEKDKKHTFIIQKYVKNNLTFNRRKFDIRTYLLMVSIGGVQKYYWYSEGYLRTSSQIYDLSDLDDPFIHLTNDAIQATGDNYGKFEKGNKVTYSEFQRYLDINYPNEKHSVSALVQKMKSIAEQVVEATYFKIDPCRKQCGFELFGMDFLVDAAFRPWLLQVNTNPCLQLSSPILQRLIPRMVQNLFRIAIDPIFQPQETQFPRNLACYIPQNIIDSNRFELIFDSLHDRNYQWETYSKGQNSSQVYEDQNQQFQNDGEIIKIQD